MKASHLTFFRAGISAIVMLAAMAGVGFADTMTPQQAREMAKRVLPFLRNNSDNDIKNAAAGNACVSCHWGAQAIWSMNEALRFGLVERKDVAKFDKMLSNLATRKLVYQMNDKCFDLFKKAGLSEEKLKEVKKVGGPFDTKEALRTKLAKLVPPEMLDKLSAELFTKATNPKYYSDPGGTIAGAMLIADAPSLTGKPAEISAGLVEHIVLLQQPDGSWKDAGQPLFPHRDQEEKFACNTMQMVLALGSVEKKSDAAVKARERGLAFLKNAKPGKSTESLLLRIRLAQTQGEKKLVEDLTAELLKQQREDGGWSSWNWLPDADSDAMATGEALYTLSLLGRKSKDPHVQRAWSFLQQSQQSDGGWDGANPKGKANRIWTYWGSSWAFIGLVRTMQD